MTKQLPTAAPAIERQLERRRSRCGNAALAGIWYVSIFLLFGIRYFGAEWEQTFLS
jgi:hypothetical protein